MRCTFCKSIFPCLKTQKCIQCGNPLIFTVEDFLDKSSPCRIVREFRAGQLALAQKVENAILNRQHFVAEAGTGIGKSIALTLPAILARRRTVISTATKVLQHQYVEKELPFLAKKLSEYGINFRFAEKKGRNNYVCRKAWQTQQDKIKQTYRRYNAAGVARWLENSEFGDVSELEETPPFWSLINAEDCPGEKFCRQARHCGYVRASALVKQADIIVANHSLVGFNIRVGMRLLPAHEVYIMDEAHQAPKYFRKALAYEFTERSISLLHQFLSANELLDDQQEEALDRAEKESEKLFVFLKTKKDVANVTPAELEVYIRTLVGYLAPIHANLFRLECLARKQLDEEELEDDELSDEINEVFGGSPAGFPPRKNVADEETIITASIRTERLYRNLNAFLDLKKEVCYVEPPQSDRGSYKLVRAPILLGNEMSVLFQTVPSVIAASATLSVGGKFDYFRRELGFPESGEFVVVSPFDFAHRALLYLPAHLPVHPSRVRECVDMEKALAAYYDALAKEIITLLRLSRGHAFILCSARSDMKELYTRVKPKVDFPVEMQDDRPVAQIEQWFRNTAGAVLFGVKSFWEGISIEGDQLRLVIIPKVPFPQKTDPVHNAKKLLMQEETHKSDYECFWKLDVPEMVMDMKQGAGRLLRTMEDYGVVAILDSKIRQEFSNHRSYAYLLVNSLPYTLISDKIELVAQFFEHFNR